jgi:paraquat-inducible protein B
MSNSNELVQQLRHNADQLSTSAQGTLDEIRRMASNANTLASPDSQLQYQLMKTLQEVANSARALRQLANTLEQHPEALIQGKSKEEIR